MAIPSTTVIWPEPMDPYDIIDYTIDISSLLEVNETISSCVATTTAEASLLGLVLDSSNLQQNVLQIWLSNSKPNEPLFDGAGVLLPIEILLVTSLGRRRQRTVAVRVVQQ